MFVIQKHLRYQNRMPLPTKPLTSPSATAPGKWLMYVMALIAFVVLIAFAKDGLVWFSGGDARAVCAAANAYGSGRDPYYLGNLNTNLPYYYVPVTLELLRPVCAGGVFVRYVQEIYLGFGLISAFLLAGFSFARRGRRDTMLKMLFVFGGLQGLQSTFRTGNLAMIDGFLSALALFLLYRGFSLQEDQHKRSELYYVSGAAILGLTLSLKLIFLPVLVGFYFLPLARARKWTLIGIAVVCFTMPILISYVFYHDLFFSWLDSMLGRIPNQMSPTTDGCNRSLYCLAQALAENAGFIRNKQDATILFYALAVTLVAGSLLAWIVHFVKREPGAGSFFVRLDRRLLANPRFAMRLATLAMLALALCAPRLREYSFFGLAVYAAMLVADLPPRELAVLFAVAIVGPLYADLPGSRSALPYIAHFAQTLAAVFCYVVLLLDLKPAFTRLAPAGQINE